MLRIKVTRSMTLARFGKTSLICKPGTDVAIGLNSPRTSAGASGLGSNVSRCDGPTRQPDQDAVLDLGASRRPSAGQGPEPEPVVQTQSPRNPSEPDGGSRDGSGHDTAVRLADSGHGHPLSIKARIVESQAQASIAPHS